MGLQSKTETLVLYFSLLRSCVVVYERNDNFEEKKFKVLTLVYIKKNNFIPKLAMVTLRVRCEICK